MFVDWKVESYLGAQMPAGVLTHLMKEFDLKLYSESFIFLHGFIFFCKLCFLQVAWMNDQVDVL